jgi:SAM-dependent methyltransferase
MAEKNNEFSPKKLRKISFSEKFVLDTNLVQYLNPHDKEFDFLRNPVVQNIYNYQINFVLDFSKEWFNKTSLDILDWGCGKGYVSYLLKNKNINVSSCDVSNSGVTSAFVINSPIISLANINLVELKHDYILPFDNSSFDVVLSFGVLEHVPNELESLLEIQRILRPNGLFFCFYLPYKLSYTQNIQHLRGQWYHKKLYWKNDVKKLLKKSNMHLLDIWHRALMPKISFVPLFYHMVEKIDNWFCNYSILKYIATNIEFVANKSR